MTEDRADDVDYCSRGEVPPDGVTRERGRVQVARALAIADKCPDPWRATCMGATSPAWEPYRQKYLRLADAVLALRPEPAPDDTADLRAQRIARNSLDDACDREADAVLRAEAAEVALAAATAREATLRAGIEALWDRYPSASPDSPVVTMDELRALLADTNPGRQS